MQAQSKLRKPIFLWVFVTFVSASSAFAISGSGNGGDDCERRIQEIREDIAQWIQKGGSAGLNLPNDVALAQYNQKMSQSMSRAEVGCQEMPVKIGSAEKTCINLTNFGGAQKILCNRAAFMTNTSENQQYVLIHHEYAGLSGFEINESESSTYSISNQLTGFLSTVEMKKLSLYPVPQGDEMTFVKIAPGAFTMGSPKNEPGRFQDEAQHRVTIVRAFEMQTTDVTQAQWVKTVGKNPSQFSYPSICPKTYEEKNGIGMCPRNPVEMVSWNDAQYFLTLLNLKRHDGYFYRLPTEAEWEYAARAETTTAYYFGDDPDLILTHAWGGINSGDQTHEVGMFEPNPWGLYDMAGNVLQWVSDSFGNSGAHYLRGGSWFNPASDLRSAARGYHNSISSNLGFRVVRVPR